MAFNKKDKILIKKSHASLILTDINQTKRNSQP